MRDSTFVVGRDFEFNKESIWRDGLDVREIQIGSNEQILEKVYAAFGFKVHQVSFRFVAGVPSLSLRGQPGMHCLQKLYTGIMKPCWVKPLTRTEKACNDVS